MLLRIVIIPYVLATLNTQVVAKILKKNLLHNFLIFLFYRLTAFFSNWELFIITFPILILISLFTLTNNGYRIVMNEYYTRLFN